MTGFFAPFGQVGDPLLSQGVHWVELLIIVVRVLVAFGALLVSVMLMIWFERKLISDMQDRIGPNRAGPFGILQTLADGIKLFFKEDLLPESVGLVRLQARSLPVDHPGPCGVHDRARRRTRHDRAPHLRAPGCGPADRHTSAARHVVDLRLRSDARGLVVRVQVPVARLGAGERSDDLLRSRPRPDDRHDDHRHRNGRHRRVAFHEGDRRQPGDALLGLERPSPRCRARSSSSSIAITAELNRPPFDLAEADRSWSEGSTRSTRRSVSRLFFMAEFMNTITMSAVVVTLFFGGPDGPAPHVMILRWLFPIFWFLGKTFAFLFIYVWLRAALPRLRYDQLMDLGWKFLIPVSLAWLLLVAVAVIFGARWPFWATVAAVIFCGGLLARAVGVGRGRSDFEDSGPDGPGAIYVFETTDQEAR